MRYFLQASFKVAAVTVRYVSKTLEKTRALYPSLIGRSAPANSKVADFDMSKTFKILNISRF